jgi:hypothetical protein
MSLIRLTAVWENESGRWGGMLEVINL